MSFQPSVIQPQPLTAETFVPYGDVIEANDQPASQGTPQKVPQLINQGLTQRYHDLAKIDVDARDGRPLVSIFRSTPLSQPIVIQMMERHPLSSQAFIPLGDNPYLVAVAEAGEFNSKAIQVFLAQSHQGVNFHRGTWHHFCLALNSVSNFLVIDRGGEGENCDEVAVEGGLKILLDKD